MEREIGFHLLKKSEYLIPLPFSVKKKKKKKEQEKEKKCEHQGHYWSGSQRFSMGCATSKPNASYEDDNWGWFQELLMKSN